MIDEPTLLAVTPLVLRLMQGEQVNFDGVVADARPYVVGGNSLQHYGNYNDAPPGSVAVHQVKGVVMKDDQYCGPSGTETLMRNMLKADRHPNITAHLMEMDSGGGEGTNIETVARLIRQDLKKPVVAWYNGVAASAAYYMAVAADEIYASEETDIVGSIGTMISFADFRGFWEAQGVKIHEVYADQSTLKNKDFRDAMEGNYELLKSKLLNPYAERFIKTVKEFRPQIQDNGEVFKGQIFMTKEARKAGMIDGMKSFEGAVQRAMQLGKKAETAGSRNAAMNRQQANINSMKNFQRISAVLGYTLEMSEGGAFLQEAELERLERNLQSQATLAEREQEVATVAQSLATINQTLQSVTNRLDTMATDMQGMHDRMSAIEDRKPGASITLPKAEQDPAVSDEVKEVPEAVKSAEENFRQALRAERRQ